MLRFGEARARFRDLGLTPLSFTHPFAQWMSARALTGAELPVDQRSLMDKEAEDKYSWNAAFEWLQPHDAATAIRYVDRFALFAASRYLPDELTFAAKRIRAGQEPASACLRIFALLKFMEGQQA
ncbi:MAG TPA: hypothetical protein VD997_16160 [Phycisphaerales bacterium]|nr:hypothetical protein [Phycisphaerales bacterium]